MARADMDDTLIYNGRNLVGTLTLEELEGDRDLQIFLIKTFLPKIYDLSYILGEGIYGLDQKETFFSNIFGPEDSVNSADYDLYENDVSINKIDFNRFVGLNLVCFSDQEISIGIRPSRRPSEGFELYRSLFSQEYLKRAEETREEIERDKAGLAKEKTELVEYILGHINNLRSVLQTKVRDGLKPTIGYDDYISIKEESSEKLARYYYNMYNLLGKLGEDNELDSDYLEEYHIYEDYADISNFETLFEWAIWLDAEEYGYARLPCVIDIWDDGGDTTSFINDVFLKELNKYNASYLNDLLDERDLQSVVIDLSRIVALVFCTVVEED